MLKSPPEGEETLDGRESKESNMDYILDFEKLDKDSLPMVGGKNASLGEMIKAAIRVPPGFAVTTDSYLLFITDADIRTRIIDRVSGLDPEDVAALNDASADVQELIKKTPMPEAVSRTNLCLKTSGVKMANRLIPHPRNNNDSAHPVRTNSTLKPMAQA